MTREQEGQETDAMNSPTSPEKLGLRLHRAVRRHQRRLQDSTAQLFENVTRLDEQLRAQSPPGDAVSHDANASFQSDALLERVEQCINAAFARTETAAQPTEATGAGNAQAQFLKEENDRLQAELEQLQLKVQFAGSDSAAEFDDEAATAIADLERQLRQAQSEAENYRLQNEELASRVANSRAQGDPAGDAGGGALSWEEQKQRLLQQLEHEDGGAAEATTAGGESITDFVARTERIIAEKDAELNELKQLLAEQADAASGVAVGAAAIADMLDQDELIREEREKLQEIQKQWREKLRNAEIELSLERAQLSRQRIELEERIAELQEGESRLKSQQLDEAEPEDANQRKWLSRLGLGSASDDED